MAACHTNSLELAVRGGIRTIAFPAISTGVCGYPVEFVAPIAHLAANPGAHDEVRFALFNAETLEVFARALRDLTPKEPM